MEKIVAVPQAQFVEKADCSWPLVEFVDALVDAHGEPVGVPMVQVAEKLMEVEVVTPFIKIVDVPQVQFEFKVGDAVVTTGSCIECTAGMARWFASMMMANSPWLSIVARGAFQPIA